MWPKNNQNMIYLTETILIADAVLISSCTDNLRTCIIHLLYI